MVSAWSSVLVFLGSCVPNGSCEGMRMPHPQQPETSAKLYLSLQFSMCLDLSAPKSRDYLPLPLRCLISTAPDNCAMFRADLTERGCNCVLRLANASTCDDFLRLIDTKCCSCYRKSMQLRLAIANSLAIVNAWFTQDWTARLRTYQSIKTEDSTRPSH